MAGREEEIELALRRELFRDACGEMRRVCCEHGIHLIIPDPLHSAHAIPDLREPGTFLVHATVMRGGDHEDVEIECTTDGKGRVDFPVVAPTPPPPPTPEMIAAETRRAEEDELIARARAQEAKSKRASELAWASAFLREAGLPLASPSRAA